MKNFTDEEKAIVMDAMSCYLNTKKNFLPVTTDECLQIELVRAKLYKYLYSKPVAEYRNHVEYLREQYAEPAI